MAKHDKYATLRVKNKRARCAGSRTGTETACPGCAGTVESGLCRLVPAHSGVPAHTSNSRFQQLACVHGPRPPPRTQEHNNQGGNQAEKLPAER